MIMHLCLRPASFSSCRLLHIPSFSSNAVNQCKCYVLYDQLFATASPSSQLSMINYVPIDRLLSAGAIFPNPGCPSCRARWLMNASRDQVTTSGQGGARIVLLAIGAGCLLAAATDEQLPALDVRNSNHDGRSC